MSRVTCCRVAGGHCGRPAPVRAQRQQPAAGVRGECKLFVLHEFSFEALVCELTRVCTGEPRGHGAAVRDVAAQGARAARHHPHLQRPARPRHQVGPQHRPGKLCEGFVDKHSNSG